MNNEMERQSEDRIKPETASHRGGCASTCDILQSRRLLAIQAINTRRLEPGELLQRTGRERED